MASTSSHAYTGAEVADICSGMLVPDVMHDILEEVLQYEAKYLLKQLISEKIITLEVLNSRLLNLDVGYMDINNRPSPIVPAALTDTSRNLKQNSSQAWLLGRMLPAAIGSYVPDDHEQWRSFLDLLAIMDILMAPRITEDELAYVQDLITDHLSNIKEVYPDMSIIPKLHYLVHMPQIAVNFGPLSRLWTMRYEAKHKYFKSLVASVKNFINLSYTLACRHQQLEATRETWNEDNIEVGPASTSTVESVELQEFFNNHFLCKWAVYHGIKYKERDAVIVLPEELWEVGDEPLFGRVLAVAAQDGQVKLLAQTGKIQDHLQHFHAYSLTFTDHIVITDVAHLSHPHPLHEYKLPGTPHQNTVIPKYHISML